jgi:NAD(P)H-flavin reductase
MPTSSETLPARDDGAYGRGPMAPVPFVLTGKRRETADTWTLELQAREPGGLPFAPGQFTMISAGGTGEVPISISGDPAGEALVHTVRAVGAATRALCESEPGEVLSVRGPFGKPWPMPALAGCDVLIVAGGIGLAPLRPAILALLRDPARYGRLTLLYGGRSPDQLLYPAELEQWPERGLEVHLTVDSAGPEWLGHVGVVPRLVRRAELERDRAQALLCGPEVMMRFTVSALEQAGLPGGRVYASMERNMQCGIGHCGHCQLGPTLVCRDGPVYAWSALERWLAIKEL